MEQIWKIVQNSKDRFTHRANNIVGESTVLTSKKGKCIKNSWNLDTGATYHISCTRQYFSNLYKIKPIHVQPPNDSFVIANHSGIIFFL